MVWPLSLLALAPVVDVVDNPNSTTSFSGVYEGFTVQSVGLPSSTSVIDITGKGLLLHSL